MAKKKSVKSSTDAKKIKDLERKFHVAKELIKSKEEEINNRNKRVADLSEASNKAIDDLKSQRDILEREVADLNQKIKDDKGIPANPNKEITELKRRIKSMDQVNKNLAQELKSFKDNPNLSNPLAQPQASSSVPIELLTACIANVDVGVNPKRFRNQVKILVENAAILAQEIANRYPNLDPASMVGEDKPEYSEEDE